MTGSHTLNDRLEYGDGRIEFVDLPHQHLQLTSPEERGLEDARPGHCAEQGGSAARRNVMSP